MQGENKNTFYLGRMSLRSIISEAVDSVVGGDDIEYVEAEDVVEPDKSGEEFAQYLKNSLNSYMALTSKKFRVRYQNDDVKFGKNEFFGGQGDDEGDKARMRELVERLLATSMKKNLVYITISEITGYNKNSAKTVMEWCNIPGRWLTREEIEDCENDPTRYIDMNATGSYIHAGADKGVAMV